MGRSETDRLAVRTSVREPPSEVLISDPKVNSPAVGVVLYNVYAYYRYHAARAPRAAKDGDAVSLGGGRSTDAATAGDGRGRSSATGPHRRRRAGLWEAVGGSPCGGRRWRLRSGTQGPPEAYGRRPAGRTVSLRCGRVVVGNGPVYF